MIDKNDKLSKIDNILPEDNNNYYSDIYNPWQTKEQLQPWLEVIKEKIVTTLIFTRASTVWIWNQSFTWFGFKPTSYKIKAWRDATWNSCTSYCVKDTNWIEWWVYNNVNAWNISESWSTTASVRILYSNSWWWNTIAWFVSFDKDWITLNFTSSDENIKMIITAYS